MVLWEYLIVALPAFEAPSHAPGVSASVAALNAEGTQGWEAVGMTSLADGLPPLGSLRIERRD